MKVLLISANTEAINMPTFPLGLACVASATREAGHDLKLLDLMGKEDMRGSIERAIEGFYPDIIGISVRNIDDQNMEDPRFLLDQAKAVVTDCKAFSDAPVVLGGAGYSMFPKSALNYLGADMGIEGDGEEAFPALVRSIQENRALSGLPGLYLPHSGLQGGRRLVKDLDRLPLPDPHLLSTLVYDGAEFWLPVQARRGCPMKCSYCSTGAIEGSLIRRHSAEAMAQWLVQWVEAGFRRFYFVDNIFNLPPSYAKALCSGIIEANLEINWRCILYPGNVDEALVKKMAKAGCKEVSLGFESGSERILKGMNKRFSLKDIQKANKILRDYGIHRMGFLLLGGPGETRESVKESLSFADSLGLDALKLTLGIRIYPNTSLRKIAIEEGVIAPDEDLLFPTFYIVKKLDDWLRKTVGTWTEERPHWHCG
jgi:radical SAM superfamily enzyme YgiQ (UPF0313 family)